MTKHLQSNKHLLILLTALFSMVTAWAQQTLTVYNGTTTDERIPVTGWHAGKYGKYEFVYPQSVLVAGSISSLRFYSTSTTNSWGNAMYRVFMKTINTTTLSNYQGQENATVVYEGSLSVANGVMDIQFTTPYTYTGGNLLIGVYQITKGSSSTCRFYGQRVNGASIVGWDSNNLANVGSSNEFPNFLPKTTFSYNSIGIDRDLTVYDGTATDEGVPIVGWCTLWYTKCEYVMPASDLTAMNGSIITSMTCYNTRSDISFGSANFKVFMKEVDFTTVEEFQGYEDATVVYEGSLSLSSQGLLQIEFSTPFEYHGGNLLIGVYNCVSGSRVESCFYYGKTGVGTSIIAWNDESLESISMGAVSLIGASTDDFLPKNTFTFTNPDGVFNITSMSSPVEGGTVTGAGEYAWGDSCTLTAIANAGYTFVNWTENGEEVSSDAEYSFTVTGNRELVANFMPQGGVPTGALNGLFSVGENTQVYFSQGNLQYQASTNTWQFAENQWDLVGDENANISPTFEGWIDLFGWGTSGWNNGNTNYQPWCSTNAMNQWTSYGPYGLYDLTDQYANSDWGVYNSILNGGEEPGIWRTLSKDEWNYIINSRVTSSGIRYAKAIVNEVCGLVLLPDLWDGSCYTFNSPNDGEADFDSNTILQSEWEEVLQINGAVFLPSAGARAGQSLTLENRGSYWSSSYFNDSNSYSTYFDGTNCAYAFYVYGSELIVDYNHRCDGLSVRLVSPVTLSYFGINATPNLAEGGTVSGSGTYNHGETCTLTATPNDGYTFVNWTENGEEVSTDDSYSFTINGNRTLVANFAKGYLIGDGGDATNVYLPSYSYYKYTLSQQIYTSEELGTDGVINSIAFYNGGAEKTRVYDFYLKTTTKTAFSNNTDWEAVSDADKVFSDSVTMAANAWTVITFDTPFVYDGVSNLVLVTDDNTGAWTNSPHMACRVFDAPNQAIRVYSDNTDYDPFNPSGYNGTLHSEKNQIIFGIIPAFRFVTSGTWDNAANWNRGVLPDTEDVVYIDAMCQLNQDAEVAALTVTEGQTLTIQSGNTLTVSGNLINTLPEGLIIEDSAQLVHASEGVYATVKKVIVANGTSRKDHYYLLANPLTSSVNPEQANIYHLTRGNYDLYNWLAGSADSLEWRNFKDFSFMMYPEGYGYLYANQGGVELLFPGVIRRSDIGFGKPVSCVADEVFHFNGWNLIGNPFVCNAYLVNEDNEPLPYYRMNAAGNDFDMDTLGTAIAPMEGIFYQASENETVYFVRTDNTSQMLFTISLSAEPADGGTVSGGGTYAKGQFCTVTAMTNEDYTFTSWTENGEVVSTNANYSFIVTANRTLVANFSAQPQTPVGAINGKFTINTNCDQVYFSQGNLQYQASTNTWRFAESQWDYVGMDNSNISSTYDGWIDLFRWGTSGYNHGAICYQPWSTSSNNGDYYAYGNSNYNLYDQTGQADWGYNAISNGGNTTNTWRTLSSQEWNYVFNGRNTGSGMRYAKAKVNDVNGVILLPDDWQSSYFSLNGTNTGEASYNTNPISSSQWTILEQHGAVFLPVTAEWYNGSVGHIGDNGFYWSSSTNGNMAYRLWFTDTDVFHNYLHLRSLGHSVRLVRSAQ